MTNHSIKHSKEVNDLPTRQDVRITHPDVLWKDMAREIVILVDERR